MKTSFIVDRNYCNFIYDNRIYLFINISLHNINNIILCNKREINGDIERPLAQKCKIPPILKRKLLQVCLQAKRTQQEWLGKHFNVFIVGQGPKNSPEPRGVIVF